MTSFGGARSDSTASLKMGAEKGKHNAPAVGTSVVVVFKSL